MTAKNGKQKYERVHRLVALAFIPNPNNYPVVNHLNGNKQDNRVENLEWTSVKRNTKHAFDNDLGGFREHLKQITEKARIKNSKTYEVYKENKLIGICLGLEETAKLAECSDSTVNNCIRENRKTRKGFYFKIQGGDADAQYNSQS